VVKTLAPLRQVGCRIEAGKGLKVVDKMGLVEIAAGQSDIRPINRLPSFDEAQHLLKAPDAAKQFWR
jgi:hypothetical protein